MTHPTQPELRAWLNVDLSLWIVLHDGRATAYVGGWNMASGTWPAEAFDALLRDMQADVTGPYPYAPHAQRAAEWLADLEGCQ